MPSITSFHFSVPKRCACLFPALILFVCIVFPRPLPAQTDALGQNEGRIPESTSSGDTLQLSLDEAVTIALENNYQIRREQLDIEHAGQQIREARSQVLPQVSLSSNYNRDVISANPFAGSEAGGMFDSFDAIDWVAYNERARTDGDPATEPITQREYMQRQQQAIIDAGLSPPEPGDNPFGVDNQFMTSLSVTQTLFNSTAFSALEAARQVEDMNRQALERGKQETIDEVRQSYYGALMAEKRVEVLQTSIERTRRTVEETGRSVEQGVLARFDELSAEVELVNLETEVIQAENDAELARRNLNRILGIPVDQPLELQGDLERLELPGYEDFTLDEAYRIALNNRPDLDQAETAVRLQEIERETTASNYLPVVNFFADLNYQGNVPDDRELIIQDPRNPFDVRGETREFFSDAYWSPDFAMGISLQWNIYSGARTRAQEAQNRISIRQSELQKEELEQGIRLQIEQAWRTLQAAERRIHSQQRNIEEAEMNYQMAERRLREGTGNSLEERQASELLDQTRLSYLSAIHDYLVALSELELALGRSLPGAEPQFQE